MTHLISSSYTTKGIGRNSSATATIEERYLLTKEGSTKQTWHLSLKLEEPLPHYEPGDSLAIYPQNDPSLVGDLIRVIGASGQELIIDKRSGQSLTLLQFLRERVNLARSSSSFLKFLIAYEVDLEKQKDLTYLLEEKERLRSFLSTQEPVDLLRRSTLKSFPIQELADLFSPLLPRFYSIASSKLKSPHHIDLTIALFQWEHKEEKRHGVASHFLCHLARVRETPIPFFIQPAHNFRLPIDPHAHLIMVGPGTGVAPFRAFMQERGSNGRHWLFFGERHRSTDFFYENEWQSYPNLQVETAFSRDQTEKIYVQDRLLEHSAELYRWIEGGAHLYVCGDAQAMAKDVERAWVQIIEREGNLSNEEAKGYLKRLKTEKRYLQDVY